MPVLLTLTVCQSQQAAHICYVVWLRDCCSPFGCECKMFDCDIGRDPGMPAGYTALPGPSLEHPVCWKRHAHKDRLKVETQHRGMITYNSRLMGFFQLR